MGTITTEAARARLAEVPGWKLEGVALVRQFSFSGFAEAMGFVVRLGFAAEAADHHPDILINYKRVLLTYSTHSEGGLTEKDFAGASAASSLAAAMGGR